MRFGVMFFATGGTTPQETCRTVLAASRLADQHGLDAVWTPERHFDEFGGVFPNPALTSAALATVTERVQLRAGSLISPLHQTVRIAEEWSAVDNWSGGRAAVSFGSGWNANDFVLAPENYEIRHRLMLEQIDMVRALWRGDDVPLTNGAGKRFDVRLHPAPVQAELPIWVTSSGNPQTFRDAGQRGANILTHLIGQDLNQLAEKVGLYRKARADSGLDPAAGTVSLMLHTHLDASTDAAEARSRGPFREYLRSAVKLELRAAQGGGAISGGHVLPDDEIPQDLLDELLDATYERYLHHGSLIGSVESCRPMVERVAGAGVDDIACLVDFGVPTTHVPATVPLIAELAGAGPTGNA
ncbi:MupA/Atu3671 family FMN-dependent luciferase-like monooxygenase [Salinispora mooreana]|uniref:MupA/Atu3671 family FMN-dependent luciferase-like monooxygenase n=1 Tax=Salinispora mooreana TaxID=999545 RepID=UPI0003AB4559|nr:MupA/Atu3671 family FMN-dependent luciferase-like monooxygenase [Salinispora mooreana]